MMAILLGAIACQKESENYYVTEPLTIEGYSSIESRTNFGTPSATEIPFYWSAGDYVWLGNTRSQSIAEDTTLGYFTFKSGVGVVGTGHIFYNMTGEAKTANVLSEQTADGNLGNDGDFGYATLDEYNTFYMEHKTSYIWFDTTSSDNNMPKLSSITLATEGIAIAGQRIYNFAEGEWDNTTTASSSTITLNFDGGYQLRSSNSGIMAAMVLLPAEVAGTKLTVTYTFEDGSTYTETKTPSKSFVSGATQRIATAIRRSDLVTTPSYELRILSFEDGTEKFTPYTITGFDSTSQSYYDHEVAKWSDLIDTPEYGGPLTYGDMGYSGEGRGCDYNWYDEGNTNLASEFPVNYGSRVYWGGGHVVSNYASRDFETYGTFEHQMTVYGDEGMGGRNGSPNFGVHYGYIDGSEYNMTEVLPYLYFKDGVARVIDHIWVNNSCYAIGCFFDGNSLTAKIGEGDYVKLVATGYRADDSTVTSEFYVCNGPENIVTDWAKWDLSPMGEVVKVDFNIIGSSDNSYGYSQPAYFCYDDVAVRFPIEK